MRLTHLLYLLLCLTAFAACANPGSGPDGGPYDETPPRLLGMTPALGSCNVSARRVTLAFDENIKVTNPSEKVVVSPPQIEMPDIKAGGRRIVVTLNDSLKPGTTYTIDFSDAIEDNNEGNPLGMFTYFFSTGAEVDTMEVAGTVLAADNLEPVKGILVGLHADTTDTAFTRRVFDRVARTDSRGQFTIKGVRHGTYRVFALKDVDGDFMLSAGEMMAMMPGTVTTGSYPDTRYDTVWHDSIYYDSIRLVRYTHYTPDDLVLRAFTPVPVKRYLAKTVRDVPEWFRFIFSAPSTVRPTVRGLNFDADTLLLTQTSAHNDTLTYWLRRTDFPEVDTLRLALTFDEWDDSLMTNVLKTDTLTLRPRLTAERRARQQQEQMEKWEKQRQKRHRKGDFSQETPPTTFLEIQLKAGQGLPLMQNPQLKFTYPLARLDTAGLRLLLRQDTLDVPAPYELRHAEGSTDSVTTGFTLRGEWRYGQEYMLEIDSAALADIYGHPCNAFKARFSYGREENFGALFVNIPEADTTWVVQLMQNDTRIERQERVGRNGSADFFYLKPGTYYLRAFIDADGNGRWTTGDYDRQRQPEEVFYYPTSLEVRANFDISQTWHPRERALTRQKPEEITKQKADKKKTPQNRNAERERNRR